MYRIHTLGLESMLVRPAASWEIAFSVLEFCVLLIIYIIQNVI